MEYSRVVCYTCITGNYDRIYDPVFITPGVDYICFTDNPAARSSVWKFRTVPQELTGLSKVKQQRVIKICPHRYLGEYDVSVWIDGNIRVKGDLRKLLSETDFSRTPLYTRIHPSRKCVYDEAEMIVRLGKDSAENINPVIGRYRAEGYPPNIGMAETNILVRAHNDIRCRMFDDAWAAELMLHSHRDQMSFNYVAWKRGFRIGYMTNGLRMKSSEYFTMMKHG